MTPWPFLKIFDVIPGWIYAAALAIVLIGGGSVLGIQTVRLSTAKTEIATLKQAREKDRADRLQLVAAHNLKVAKMQADHAKTQQEIISGYTDQILKLQGERALAVARADRVQLAAASNAARDRKAARDDPAACERVADNNGVLYDLVAEGFRLVEEGRILLGERDTQVNTLKAIITNDRAAICGAGN